MPSAAKKGRQEHHHLRKLDYNESWWPRFRSSELKFNRLVGSGNVQHGPKLFSNTPCVFAKKKYDHVVVPEERFFLARGIPHISPLPPPQLCIRGIRVSNIHEVSANTN